MLRTHSPRTVRSEQLLGLSLPLSEKRAEGQYNKRQHESLTWITKSHITDTTLSV